MEHPIHPKDRARRQVHVVKHFASDLGNMMKLVENGRMTGLAVADTLDDFRAEIDKLDSYLHAIDSYTGPRS